MNGSPYHGVLSGATVVTNVRDNFEAIFCNESKALISYM